MKTITLEEHELGFLKEHFQEQVYNTSTELFYEGHIPHVGYVLLDGNVILGKRKKIKDELVPGTVLGVRELVNNIPVPYFARIYSGSKVYIVDRSSIKGLHQIECPNLSGIINKIIAP